MVVARSPVANVEQTFASRRIKTKRQVRKMAKKITETARGTRGNREYQIS